MRLGASLRAVEKMGWEGRCDFGGRSAPIARRPTAERILNLNSIYLRCRCSFYSHFSFYRLQKRLQKPLSLDIVNCDSDSPNTGKFQYPSNFIIIVLNI